MKPRIKSGYPPKRAAKPKPLTIPKLLRDYLERTGYTSEQAAQQIGDIPISTFNDWLYGKKKPSASSRALIMERIK